MKENTIFKVYLLIEKKIDILKDKVNNTSLLKRHGCIIQLHCLHLI